MDTASKMANSAVNYNSTTAEIAKQVSNDVKIIARMIFYIIPRMILIVCIGILIYFIFLGTTYTDFTSTSIMTTFVFTIDPCKNLADYMTLNKPTPCKLNISKYESIQQRTGEPIKVLIDDKEYLRDFELIMRPFIDEFCPNKKSQIDDFEGFFQPFMYVCKAAFLVCGNIFNIVIKQLASILYIDTPYPCFGILAIYILFIMLSTFFHVLITYILGASKSNGSQDFKQNITYAIFSVIVILFLFCLSISIITYITYLLYALVTISTANTAVTSIIRFLLFFLIIIIPLGMWYSGFNLYSGKLPEESTKEGCVTSNNWIMLFMLIFIIPVLATVKQLVSFLMNGFTGLMCYLKEPHPKIYVKGRAILGYGLLLILFIVVWPIIVQVIVPKILNTLNVGPYITEIYTTFKNWFQ